MLDARIATFSDKWPYEHLSGWVGKTRALADAGWKYTPCAGSEDMATCVYCQLALDGWEQNDDPMYEHLSRSQNCHFFRLLKAYGQKYKKTAKGKGRSVRTTSHSIVTTEQSMLDSTAEVEDSVVTTASTAKRSGRKKTTSTKGRKTRAKKAEPIEVEDGELEPPPKPAPRKRATRGKAKADDSSIITTHDDVSIANSTRNRGKKRTSNVMEDSAATDEEAPAPKKRATRGKAKAAEEPSIVEEPSKRPIRKGRADSETKRKPTRKVSGRIVSGASTTPDGTPPRALIGELPDNDAIDRQLLADLNQPFSDDDELHADSDIMRHKAPFEKTRVIDSSASEQDETVVHHEVSQDYQNFDPTPHNPDEEELDEELEAMEINGKQFCHKGSKISLGSGAKSALLIDHKNSQVMSPVIAEPVADSTDNADEHEASFTSTGTVIRNELSDISVEVEGDEEVSMVPTVENVDNATMSKHDASHTSTSSQTSALSQSMKRGKDDVLGSESIASRTSQNSVASEHNGPAMEVDGDDSFRSAKESAETASIPGSFPGAFSLPPSKSRQHPPSPSKKPTLLAKDASFSSLPQVRNSPAPPSRSSAQISRPVSPQRSKATIPSPFRQAVMSPLKAVQAAFSSPNRAGLFSPSREKFVSSKESLLPASSRDLSHSPTRHALSQINAPSKESPVSSPVRDPSPHCRGAEMEGDLSSAHQDDPFISTEPRQSLLTFVMKEPVLTSPSRHDPLSPFEDDIIMSDDEGPGTPTPLRRTSHTATVLEHHSPSHSTTGRLAPPATPGHGISPSASARQAVVSPSQSPQSSDAENRPPGSLRTAPTPALAPALTLDIMSKRPIIAPVPPKTPGVGWQAPMSPARRNMLGATPLEKTVPWSPIDLDKVFVSGIELEDRANNFFDPKEGKLSSPELKMTVEDWVYYRGKRAEKFLKEECEEMVNEFEKKGMQALRAVEGLVVSEE